MKKPSKFKAEDVWIQWKRLGFGLSLYVLFSYDHPMPLGFVWGVGSGGKRNRFDVYGSYVIKFARRRGVRTLINQTILKSYPIVMTQNGTRYGEAFMRASGYHYNKNVEYWYKEQKSEHTVKRTRRN